MGLNPLLERSRLWLEVDAGANFDPCAAVSISLDLEESGREVEARGSWTGSGEARAWVVVSVLRSPSGVVMESVRDPLLVEGRDDKRGGYASHLLEKLDMN
jgi:hypothetical protein